jgi:hypothetical protein
MSDDDKNRMRKAVERISRMFEEFGGTFTHYILDNERRPARTDILTFAAWYENFDNRRVAETFTEHHHISTVFLGFDHGWGDGPPVLFETMVFGKDENRHVDDAATDIMCRYVSWDDAETGHKTVVKQVLKLERQASAVRGS